MEVPGICLPLQRWLFWKRPCRCVAITRSFCWAPLVGPDSVWRPEPELKKCARQRDILETYVNAWVAHKSCWTAHAAPSVPLASQTPEWLSPRHGQCSTTPEELYSWLWALVLRSRVVGGVSLLWRATASCERLRRMCLGELVGLSGAESGACQSRLGSAMHWRELSAS